MALVLYRFGLVDESRYNVVKRDMQQPDIPMIMEMKAKEARRAWARFMADNEWDLSPPVYSKARAVAAAIETVILNKEYHAEVLTRQHLADRLDEFTALLRRVRDNEEDSNAI